MDGRRFDLLTKAVVAEGRSRRSILKGLTATLLGTAVLAQPEIGAAAARCRRRHEVCRKDGDCCDGYCQQKDAHGRKRCGCQIVTTLTINATNPSPIDTGVLLQPGQTAYVTATGLSSWCDGCGNHDANGDAPCGFLGIPFDCGSLVGTIGAGDIFTDYTPFVELGTEGSITATTAGNLTLQYVDGCSDCYDDNSGGFTVTIELCPAPV